MWSFGLLLVMLGYALVYVGWMNFRTGGQGPTLADALGIPQPNVTLTGKGKTAGNLPGYTGRRTPGTAGNAS